MKKIISLICGSVVLIGAAARAEQPPVAPQTHLVGAAVRDITPDYPIRLSGFGSRRTESEGVTVPIHARALAIGADAEGPVVLLVVDTTGVSDSLVSEVARRLQPLGIRPERLAVTGTHTHTAPMLRGVLPTLFGQPVPPDHQAHIDRYTTELIDRLEEVARDALAARQPAHLFWSIGKVGFAKNRRTAGGPTDHALPVLAVRSPEGKLRAVLTTYANHAVTLSHNFIGGDWPGFAAGAIEEKHPGVVALVSIGCGADQNPVSAVTGDKVDVARSQGAELAAEVERVLGGSLRPVTGPLTARLERIDLPLAPLPPRQHWESLVAKGGAVGYHAQVQMATLDRGEPLPVKVDYPIQTWTFGDSLAMVFLAGEVVVDYSLRLKRELDASRLWVTAYANDTPCYIPSERVLKEGGYEGAGAMTYYNKPAPFDVGVEQRIIDTVLRLLPAGYQPGPGDALARSILDATKSNAEREKLLADASVDAGALITAMAKDLEPGTPEEYVRIPWIWRAAVAAGRRNQTAEMKSLLAASLPTMGEPLRDWQAVVIGGGVIHGISLTGAWPADRLKELLRGEKDLSARWKRVPDLAVVMAADESVKTGTRYDALRILGVESWKKRGATLTSYLGAGIHAEVQSGAIGALNDMRAKEVGPALIGSLKNFSDRNRNAALNALLRDDSRMAALLDAVAAGRLTVSDLGEARVQKLNAAENKKVRSRAEQLFNH
jgi:neutral/alkaline ceramidase-like enzyme